MTDREALAKLKANIKKPFPEFAKTDVAIELFRNVDLLKKLEPFKLPEVTKLICSQNDLLHLFGVQYEVVRPYFVDSSIEYMQESFSDKNKDSNYFIADIFPLADDIILKSFLDAYARNTKSLQRQHDSLQKERDNELRLKAKLEEKTKELESLEAEFSKLSEDNQERAELKKKIGTCKGTVTKTNKELEVCQVHISETDSRGAFHSEIFSRLREANAEALMLSKLYETKLSLARESAFEICDNKNVVIKLLEQYSTTRKAPAELVEGLKQYDFSIRFLSAMEQPFDMKQMTVFANLYEDGLVDICEEPFHSFLENHATILSEYIVSTFIRVKEDGAHEDDCASWIDFILEREFDQQRRENSIHLFDHVWDCVDSSNKWDMILRDLSERHDEEMFLYYLSNIILRTSGAARKHLLNTSQKLIDEGIIDGLGALVGELINNHIPGDDCPAIVDYFIQKYDDSLQRLQKNNARLQFKVNRAAGDLFGAISEAVEALETLASNVDSAGNSIAPSLIASKLKKNIVSLREGLSVAGIKPLVDYADWTTQKTVPFDSEKHSISVSTPPQTVYLRTLGFVYDDVEGSEKTIPAKVGRLQEISSQSKPFDKSRAKPHKAHRVKDGHEKMGGKKGGAKK